MMKVLRFNADYATDVMMELPSGYINKTICGCGLTTVALENDADTVIAVPTIYLALNKATQYPNERYDGEVLPVWGDTTQEEINKYLQKNRVIKIMVTYDSLHKVRYLLDRCKLVIDESNELLSKTKLKPEVINNLFNIAYCYKNTVSFVSATPTPLEYMPKWVSEIEQVKIEWDNTIKTTPILCQRTYPYKSLKNEFIMPLKENGSMTVANKTFSKVIVFINSVKNIADIVNDCDLNKTQCGVICGDSLKNDSKIVGINRYVNGEMPKYLFVTSSGFCGIDLVDSDAMTIVVSNNNKKYQMVDMLTDLKQAVSRQRDKSNPNYGTYIYIYNQSLFEKSQDDLLNEIDEVYDKITNSIILYDYSVTEGIKNGFVPYPDFIAYTLLEDDKYHINEQAFNADRYYILETRNQYSKGFDIKGAFSESITVEPIILPIEVKYSDVVEYFKANHVDGVIDWGVMSTRTEWIAVVESCYRFYKKVWEDYTYAKNMINNYGDSFELLKIDIKSSFKTGSRYNRKDIKDILNTIYKKHGINRKAKHSDLIEVFGAVKEVKINGERYVEIIKK
jgi:hypothetical protein